MKAECHFLHFQWIGQLHALHSENPKENTMKSAKSNLVACLFISTILLLACQGEPMIDDDHVLPPNNAPSQAVDALFNSFIDDETPGAIVIVLQDGELL